MPPDAMVAVEEARDDALETLSKVILPELARDECYLAALLQDRSGLDIAEFCWVDELTDGSFGCYRAHPFQWCVAGETEVLTAQGVRPIRSLLGGAELLTVGDDGIARWVQADVRAFGKQQLLDLTVERYGMRHVIRATAEHRWFAGAGPRKWRRYPELRTVDLTPGMFLRSAYPRRPSNVSVAPYGVVHGLVWGDGTREKNNGCTLRLWGHSLECARFMLGPGVPENRPDVSVPGRRWSLLPSAFKDPVPLDESASYLLGWLAGYFAADGSVNPDGTCQLESTSRDSVALARDVAIRLGVATGPITVFQRTGFGEGGPAWRVTLCSSDLPAEFFLLSAHRAKWQARPERSYRPREWRVESVLPSTDVEEVFCAVVPDTHNFVIEGYIVTGNCWWRDPAPKQADQAGRSVGKSESIKARACAFPFNFPGVGSESVLIAPEGKHVDAITSRIEAQFRATRLLNEMLVPTKRGITQRPFTLRFLSGATYYTRLPGRLGTGVKGIHPVRLEVDEAQDISEKTWNELPEVVRWDVDGATWRIHGVSKGVRDKFYDYTTKASMGFKVHRITRMALPGWTPEERALRVEEYGGSDRSPDFRRNVYGDHGDQMNRIFVLSDLLRGTFEEGSPESAEPEYCYRDITGDDILARSEQDARERDHDIAERTDAQVAAMLSILDFPPVHERWSVTWAGMDIGLVADPSEILVAAEYDPSAEERRNHKKAAIAVPPPGQTRIRVITRIKLSQVPEPLQIELIMAVIEFYRPRAFAFDGTGQGLPLFQHLQARAGTSRLITFEPDEDASDAQRAAFRAQQTKAQAAVTVIKSYTFGEKVLVEFDEAKAADLPPNTTMKETIEKAGIKQVAKDRATDVLRTLVGFDRWLMPYDRDMINDLNAQTWQYCVDSETLAYTRRGWRRYDELVVGEELYGMDPVTGLGAWTVLCRVNVFSGMQKLRRLESQTHSSLTTVNHRWLVRRKRHWRGDYVLEWRTSDQLNSSTMVAKAASAGSLPPVPVYADDLVELAAWATTEGNIEKWKGVPGRLTIGQSSVVNGSNCDRIRTLLVRLTGETSCRPWARGAWHENTEGNGMVKFRVGRAWSARLFEVMDTDTKALRRGFLDALTSGQLALLIHVMLLGDGDGIRRRRVPVFGQPDLAYETPGFSQSVPARVDAFEYACVLAGVPFRRRRPFKGMTGIKLHRWAWSAPVHPAGDRGVGYVDETVREETTVWCPTTTIGSWLACRDGSVYFTGNSVEPVDPYGKRRYQYSAGSYHILDAARMLALGWSQAKIEEIVGTPPKRGDVLDLFF